MYGTQTKLSESFFSILFENDVKMYGTQTDRRRIVLFHPFENDVKMYGTQTSGIQYICST